MWVITGPIFDPSKPIETIGDQDEAPIAIPHALFKILIKAPESGSLPDVLALIYEQPRDDYQFCPGRFGQPAEREAVIYDHTDNLVSVTEIEQGMRLTVLRDLAVKQAVLADFKAQKADALWPVEGRFYGRKCGG